jgi:hypothetical protein
MESGRLRGTNTRLGHGHSDTTYRRENGDATARWRHWQRRSKGRRGRGCWWSSFRSGSRSGSRSGNGGSLGRDRDAVHGRRLRHHPWPAERCQHVWLNGHGQVLRSNCIGSRGSDCRRDGRSVRRSGSLSRNLVQRECLLLNVHVQVLRSICIGSTVSRRIVISIALVLFKQGVERGRVVVRQFGVQIRAASK